MWITSCTKLVTSVAALQMVEKGLVGLDEDIGRGLTEWKSPGILEGLEEDTGKPILKNKMTPSGSASLGEYFARYTWGPLGLTKDWTFKPQNWDKDKPRVLIQARTPNGSMQEVKSLVEERDEEYDVEPQLKDNKCLMAAIEEADRMKLPGAGKPFLTGLVQLGFESNVDAGGNRRKAKTWYVVLVRID
ncbi:hypothetical protein VKT23_001720 [Stygiomarasmius scandens]|uniref:Beta-lactamase-related domain-containing protein n=1 Tax=Marasmiellus scandens TaxID=2682957 RepID=A0ABR1K092_9AGAR